jgi:oxygen-dependent protoporphyrinogen oxidase
MTEQVDLVVVGGGITGLAAAWEAAGQGARVVLLDGAETAGGKLRTSPVAGTPLDESADAFLARVPEAVDLCTELGLETELVSPATGHAFVWSRGELRPLPAEQLLGVPTDLDALAATGILSDDGLVRARQDLDRHGDGDGDRHGDGDDGSAGDGAPAAGGDESVGHLVRRRLGDEVLDRLVGPLVGGIWAGDPDQLSIDTAAPQLAALRDRGPSLVRAAAEARAAALATAGARPVFLAPRRGMAALVDALVAGLGDRVRPGRPVHRIEPLGLQATRRWRVEPAGITTDAVVVATPAYAAAPLVAPCAPGAGDMLAGIDHASVALVALAVPRDGVDHPLEGSGFLVPRAEGRLMTACSWWSSKWPHLASRDPSLVLLRVSAGRDGDQRALALDDAELLDALLLDLRDTLDLHATPVDLRINRWHRSFPQPRPGHLARVAAVEDELARSAPGLAVAGAWARGVGIPACIRSGRRAAVTALGMRSSAR